MSSQLHHHHYFVSNLTNLGAPASQRVSDLAVSQFGFFDVEKGRFAANAAGVRVFSVLQKRAETSANPPGVHNYPGTFFQTMPFKATAIKNVTAVRARARRNMRIAIGFDGEDRTLDLKIKNGTRKMYRAWLTGDPIFALFGPQGYKTNFAIEADCNSKYCDQDCNPCDFVPSEKVAIELARQINNEPQFGRLGFITARPIFNCTTPAAVTSTNMREWVLSVQDSGDVGSLAAVQAAYPSLRVSRKSYNAQTFTSVYSVILAAAAASPTAFSTGLIRFIPDCATCPAGYTTVAATNMFKVTLPSGVNNLTTASTIQAQVAATQIVRQDGYDVVHVYVATTRTVAETTAEFTAEYPTAVVEFVRVVNTACTLTTPVNVAWVQGATGKTFTRNFVISLPDTICGQDRLAELNTAYASVGAVTLVTDNSVGTTACVQRYQIPVQSTVVLDGCYPDYPEWTAPAAYGGQIWKEVIPATNGTGCVAGVIVDVTYTPHVPNVETFKIRDFNNETIRIAFSDYEIDYTEEAGGNNPATPVKVLRFEEQAIGLGALINIAEEKSMLNELRAYSNDAGVRLAEGFRFFADPNAMYDEYVVEIQHRVGLPGWNNAQEEMHFLHFVTPAGRGNHIESFLNGLIETNKLSIPTVSIAGRP